MSRCGHQTLIPCSRRNHTRTPGSAVGHEPRGASECLLLLRALLLVVARRGLLHQPRRATAFADLRWWSQHEPSRQPSLVHPALIARPRLPATMTARQALTTPLLPSRLSHEVRPMRQHVHGPAHQCSGRLFFSPCCSPLASFLLCAPRHALPRSSARRSAPAARSARGSAVARQRLRSTLRRLWPCGVWFMDDARSWEASVI